MFCQAKMEVYSQVCVLEKNSFFQWWMGEFFAKFYVKKRPDWIVKPNALMCSLAGLI